MLNGQQFVKNDEFVTFHLLLTIPRCIPKYNIMNFENIANIFDTFGIKFETKPHIQ